MHQTVLTACRAQAHVLVFAAIQHVCVVLGSCWVCWSVGVNSVGANIAKGSVPWLNDFGFTVGFFFLFFSCIVTASTGRETRGVLYQMDLSPIFGLWNALINYSFSSLETNHKLTTLSDFTLGSRQMFLINCFQSAVWVKSRQDNYGEGILEWRRQESMYMWDTYMSVQGGANAPLTSDCMHVICLG